MSYVDPLDIPDMNQDDVFRYVRIVGRIPITPSTVHQAVLSKDLVPTKLSGKNRFTRRSALKWVESMGIPVDFDVARATRKRELAAEELALADATLAELG